MRSSTPIVFGFLALVGLAFWYDAHSRELVGGAVGEARAAAATATAPAAAGPEAVAAARGATGTAGAATTSGTTGTSGTAGGATARAGAGAVDAMAQGSRLVAREEK